MINNNNSLKSSGGERKLKFSEVILGRGCIILCTSWTKCPAVGEGQGSKMKKNSVTQFMNGPLLKYHLKL